MQIRVQMAVRVGHCQFIHESFWKEEVSLRSLLLSKRRKIRKKNLENSRCKGIVVFDMAVDRFFVVNHVNKCGIHFNEDGVEKLKIQHEEEQ